MFDAVDTIEYVGSGHSGVINRLLSENVRVLRAVSKQNKLIIRTYSRDRQKIIVLFDGLCYNYKIIKVNGAKAVYAFLRRRWALPLAAIVAITVACLIPRFVYSVQFNCDGADENEIAAVVNAHGVVRGAFIPNIDVDAVAYAVAQIDGVAFADVVVLGSTVIVSAQPELPPVSVYDVSGGEEVVSIRDAVITRQLIYAGSAVHKAGDVVRRGDVLISPDIAVGDKTVTLSARGEVYGLVNYTAEVLFTETRVQRIKSGREFTESVTCFLGLDGRAKGSPYEMYETRVVTEKSGFLIPLSVRRITYLEIVETKTVWSFSEAEESLRREAMAFAQASLPEDAVVKNRTIFIRQTGAGIVVQAVISAEQRIDIP